MDMKTVRPFPLSHLLCLTVPVAFFCAGTAEPVAAADWPARDITLIVPFAAGGGYDITARATAPWIEKHLPKKMNVVVKNVTGAGGEIGILEMVRAKTDGGANDRGEADATGGGNLYRSREVQERHQ
jgi:tripartite-type tricarboxylate transporter receptor subunit TctC